ncbi:MAG: hypothetical protein LBU83_06040 [Bacteroidales bacterium]|jgi:hypothetical protein|nr:hypothetical protein [Bacteroidales bacterium]
MIIRSQYTGLKKEVSICAKVGRYGTNCKKSAKYETKVKFDPCNGEKDIANWPYFRVDDLVVVGKYNKDKVEIDSIKYWISKNKENIIKVSNFKISWILFISFLQFSREIEDLEGYLYIDKRYSGLPVDVWIPEWGNSGGISFGAVCTDDFKFVGVVSIFCPEQSIFIKGYKKYAKTVSKWVGKNRKDIFDYYRSKKNINYNKLQK